MPRLPRRLPVSYGKALSRDWRDAVDEMRSLALKPPADVDKHEAVLVHAVATARWIEEIPRVSQSFVEKVWVAIREWVALLPGRPTEGISCWRCGENRLARMMGVGVVTQHAAILSASPPIAHIQPAGCTHTSFVIECTTCGSQIGGEFAPVVGPPPSREAPKSEPQDDESKKWSIN